MKYGKANFIGSRYYGLNFGEKYLLEPKSYGTLVYDMSRNFICLARTDAFDHYENA